MPNIRVMHYGLGPIGAAIVKQVAARPGFKIVGAIDIDPAKVGRDLGDVVGLPKRIGVKVWDDAARALKAAKADVVVLCTSSSIKKVMPQIETILKSKTAIVSTTEELSYPGYTHIRLARQIHTMAKKAKVGVLGTGVNPGFAMDVLPLMLTAPCRKVNRVVVTRIVDAGTRRLPLQRKVGAGLNLAQFRRALTEGSVRHVGLPESVYMIAAGLGWKLAKVDESIEPAVAPRDLDTEYLRVPAGNAAGIKQSARGYLKSGELCISLDLHMYVGAENPRDHVLIDGEPPIDMTISGGVAGDIATAAIAINAIPRLLAAPAGVMTMKDLPPVVRFGAHDLKTLPKRKR
jgi:4-hydroxy-tetrahydrodipicolinate reductase